MKKYLFIIICSVFCTLSVSAANGLGHTWKRSNRQTVVLSCDIHCQGCCDKIMKNIAFEKGVKDIVCDLDTKTVTLTYDTTKTDLPTLLKAFEKIHKPAKVKEAESQEPKAKSSKTDADSGASTPY